MRTTFLILSCFLLISCIGIEPRGAGSAKPISHDIWNELLKEHVKMGKVNYQGFIADSNRLNIYLDLLSKNHPNTQNWSEKEQLAYWINAYNAFTIRLIIRNFPLESIKDIAGSIPFVNSPWDIKFIKIEDEIYDLNNIEHGIIRSQFDEPRIHFALVCASRSCPDLRPEAYTSEKLEEQLDDQTRLFINDTTKNKIEGNQWRVSKIFLWYGSDFKSGAVKTTDFILKYLDERPKTDHVKLGYLDYDWSLNN